MPVIKYLCIDDELNGPADDLLSRIENVRDDIKMDRMIPGVLDVQVKDIVDEAKKNPHAFGLLLDLRLDLVANSEHKRVSYRGPTLAQELRTRMTEKSSPSFPIVLWSIDANFAKSFSKDNTSHDLFDVVYGKDQQILRSPDEVAAEMHALVAGYACLTEARRSQRRSTSASILGLQSKEVGGVYGTMVSKLDDAIKNHPIHSAAQIIVKQLIGRSGLLVDQHMLAARLGVDLTVAGDSWPVLLKRLTQAEYSGPFSSGWKRWWWFRVEDWWNGLPKQQINLRGSDADARVKFLNKQFHLSLVASLGIDQSYSTRFFTLCVASEKPLDPVDGLRVVQTDKVDWQDTRYVSVDAALRRVAKEKWKIDPLDRGRFDQIKKTQKAV